MTTKEQSTGQDSTDRLNGERYCVNKTFVFILHIHRFVVLAVHWNFSM